MNYQLILLDKTTHLSDEPKMRLFLLKLLQLLLLMVMNMHNQAIQVAKSEEPITYSVTTSDNKELTNQSVTPSSTQTITLKYNDFTEIQ